MAFTKEKRIAVKVLDNVCGTIIKKEGKIYDSIGRDQASGHPLRVLVAVPKLRIIDGLGAAHDALAGVVDNRLIPSIRRDIKKLKGK